MGTGRVGIDVTAAKLDRLLAANLLELAEVHVFSDCDQDDYFTDTTV
jgi:hypothetical protein